jgi:hypothetical protein
MTLTLQPVEEEGNGPAGMFERLSPRKRSMVGGVHRVSGLRVC